MSEKKYELNQAVVVREYELKEKLNGVSGYYNVEGHKVLSRESVNIPYKFYIDHMVANHADKLRHVRESGIIYEIDEEKTKEYADYFAKCLQESKQKAEQEATAQAAFGQTFSEVAKKVSSTVREKK